MKYYSYNLKIIARMGIGSIGAIIALPCLPSHSNTNYLLPNYSILLILTSLCDMNVALIGKELC